MLKAYYENMLIAVTKNEIERNGEYYFPKERINFSVLKKSIPVAQVSHQKNIVFYDLKTERIHEKNVACCYLDVNLEGTGEKNYILFNDKIEIIKT